MNECLWKLAHVVSLLRICAYPMLNSLRFLHLELCSAHGCSRIIMWWEEAISSNAEDTTVCFAIRTYSWFIVEDAFKLRESRHQNLIISKWKNKTKENKQTNQKETSQQWILGQTVGYKENAIDYLRQWTSWSFLLSEFTNC